MLWLRLWIQQSFVLDLRCNNYRLVINFAPANLIFRWLSIVPILSNKFLQVTSLYNFFVCFGKFSGLRTMLHDVQMFSCGSLNILQYFGCKLFGQIMMKGDAKTFLRWHANILQNCNFKFSIQIIMGDVQTFLLGFMDILHYCCCNCCKSSGRILLSRGLQTFPAVFCTYWTIAQKFSFLCSFENSVWCCYVCKLRLCLLSCCENNYQKLLHIWFNFFNEKRYSHHVIL